MTFTYMGATWRNQVLPSRTAKKAVEKQFKGGKPHLLTETEVLECRARHDFFGWTMERCARIYGMERTYMKRLLEYTVRSRLIAKPEHANLKGKENEPTSNGHQ